MTPRPLPITGTTDRYCVAHARRLRGDAECALCPRAPMDAAVVSSGRRPKRGGDTEAMLAAQLADAGYVDVADFDDTWPLHKFHRMFVRQFAWALRCDPPRGFASDFAFIEKRLLVEIKGLAHAAGRKKVKADVEREGLAVSLGWRVLPLTPESVRDGTAVALITAALAAHKEE